MVAIDDVALRRRAVRLLEDPDIHILVAGPRYKTESALLSRSYDVAIVAASKVDSVLKRLPGQIAELRDAPELIVLLDDPTPEATAQVAAMGTIGVLSSGLADPSLGPALLGMVRSRQLDARRAQPSALLGAADLRRCAATFDAVGDQVKRVARGDAAVLIKSELGSPNAAIARKIHEAGPRSHGAFVAINCANVEAARFEGMLFGHERGAFTGAHRARRGAFERAHGGTLFLDEVGQTPADLHVKLLRALQERHIRPLGADVDIEVNVRVVAASTEDLAAATEAGRFRRDLFLRLSVAELTVPPLRDRLKDLLTVAKACAAETTQRWARAPLVWDEAALDAIASYRWPGNEAELIDVVERAVLGCAGERIGIDDLPSDLAAGVAVTELDAAPSGDPAVVKVPPSWSTEPWTIVRDRITFAAERAYIEALLEATEGRVAAAASRAGFSLKGLTTKMRRHGLRKESFRPAASDDNG